MTEQNIYVLPKALAHHAISVSHDDAVLEQIATAMDKAMKITAEGHQ